MFRISLLAAVMFGAAVLPAQVQWIQAMPSTTPSPRSEHATVELLQQGAVMLFGGAGAAATSTTRFNDTWLWNGTNWNQVMTATSTTPTRRAGHMMSYDLVRNRVVMFSGWSGGNYIPDTWEYDAAGQTWSMLTGATTTPPSARDWGSLTYDLARQQSVLFGGHDFQMTPDKFGDTWLWDGTTWQQATPATSPPRRLGHGAVYDPSTGRVVIFGGDVNGVGAHNDMWVWDGTNWTQLQPATSPPARAFPMMAYDSLRQRIVLFGGTAGGAQLNDVWEFDGSTWIQRTPIGGPPVGRHLGAMSFDTPRNGMVMFGGALDSGRSQVAGDTWLYGTPAPATSRSFGTGCPGSAGTPTLDCGNLAWGGNPYRITLSSAPAGAPVVTFFGFSNTMLSGIPLPLSLAPLGIPCSLRVAPTITLPPLPASATGTLTIRFRVPPTSTLWGISFFAQALVIDAGAPGNVTLTNGCEHVIGAL